MLCPGAAGRLFPVGAALLLERHEMLWQRLCLGLSASRNSALSPEEAGAGKYRGGVSGPVGARTCFALKLNVKLWQS